MSEPTGFRSMIRSMLQPRRALIQALGFLAGLALVVWVVKGAIDAASDPSRAGILESLRTAWAQRPMLIIGISLTTAISLIIDGALFWMVLLPVRRLAFMEIQWLTFVTATSNFFPIRLGIPVRYAYALLANRLTFKEATVWFVAVTLVVLVSLVAVVAATALVPVPGFSWAILVLIGLGVSALLLQWAMKLPVAATRIGTWSLMITNPGTYWTGTVLRVVEVLLWIVRMWCAAEILNLGLSFATVTVLGVAAIAVMLNPFGRIGFREATTVLVANWMAGGGIDVAHADGGFKQLALLESLGEMFTTIPLGLVAIPFLVSWYRARRRESFLTPR